MSDDRHEAVSRRAYALWEKDGGVHGRHDDHWHQAASELEGEDAAAAQANDVPLDDAPSAAVTTAGATAAPDGTTMDAAPAASKRARSDNAPAAKAPRKPKSK